MRLLIALVMTTLVLNSALAREFSSAEKQTVMLELYTSEGCSSCPPADAWLRKLTEHPGLWTELVPIAFHVDYWNQLGWPDRFSSAKYSARQRAYRHSGATRSVYTPGFVVDGKEWRGWFAGHKMPAPPATAPGRLQVSLEQGVATVRFAANAEHRNLEVHVATLGFDLKTPVKAGENRGRDLNHDFVVLDHEVKRLSQEDGQWQSRVPIPVLPDAAPRQGIAVWVSKPGDPAPIQATGSWL